LISILLHGRFKEVKCWSKRPLKAVQAAAAQNTANIGKILVVRHPSGIQFNCLKSAFLVKNRMNFPAIAEVYLL